MNLKINNEVRGSANVLHVMKPTSTVKEERQRTGRFIAVLVGILLFLLAIYHAWVRKIPIVASLVVPALIMFVYVGWVLYTASRDKHRLLDLEAALNEAAKHELELHEAHNNMDISIISSKETSKANSPEDRCWAEISSVLLKGETFFKDDGTRLVKPLILVNDQVPDDDDPDKKWNQIVEVVNNNDKLRGFHTRKKLKRKFCRSRRHAVYKRSYSIG